MSKGKNLQKIVILGAGLAGLTAAYELAKNKKEVIVIEQADKVGGLARTVEKNGFKFDTGPHRWYTKNNKVNDWMLNLMDEEIIRVPRLTRIYFDKKFFYYPIRLVNALSGIGLVNSCRAIVDYVIARVNARFFSQKMVTMEDGYINQFGKTLYDIFFKRYSEKLWGEDCKKISIDWVGQRTRGLNIITILKDTLIKSKKVVSLVDEFSYPKDGVGRIAEKLAEGIRKNKGKIITNNEVCQINTTRGTINSVVVQNKNGKQDIRGDQFISSIPLNELIHRLNPAVPLRIRRLALKLRYRDELQVAIFVKKNHITQDTWIYVHPKEIPFMRFMEMDNWSDRLSPKGTTTLVFEIACNVGDSMWLKKDKEIIKMVLNAYIDEFKSISKNDYLGGYVHRVAKEYPVYHIGYRGDVDQIKKYVNKYKNLQLIGRNGTFRYNNMDHSIEMGLFAAWNIISGGHKYDIESVNIEREYLEEKKIENVEDETLEELNNTQTE